MSTSSTGSYEKIYHNPDLKQPPRHYGSALSHVPERYDDASHDINQSEIPRDTHRNESEGFANGTHRSLQNNRSAHGQRSVNQDQDGPNKYCPPPHSQSTQFARPAVVESSYASTSHRPSRTCIIDINISIGRRNGGHEAFVSANSLPPNSSVTYQRARINDAGVIDLHYRLPQRTGEIATDGTIHPTN